MAKTAPASAATNPPAPQASEGDVDAPNTPTPAADQAGGQESDSGPAPTDTQSTDPMSAPEPPASPSEPILCRVNWRFDGFLGKDRLEGDEVECTEADAAPFLGGVLTRIA